MSTVDEHLDILQNIETMVSLAFNGHPEMTDFTVARVYEALIDSYTAELLKRPSRITLSSDLEKELFQTIWNVTEWRIGRVTPTDRGENEPSVDAVSFEKIIQCLKRLRKSVNTWTKRQGQQGYLVFISQFSG